MVKNGKDKQLQTVLGVVFMVSMLLGFGAVAYIDYEYQNNGVSETLWVSDTDTTFASAEYTGEPTPYFDHLETSQRVSMSVFWQWNKTPVYQGLDTWAISLNDTGTSVDFNSGVIVIDYPNLENWLVEEIIINMTENNDDSYLLAIGFQHFAEAGIDKYGANPSDAIYFDYGIGTGGWDNTSYTIDTNLAISINNNANNNEQSILYIIYGDDGANWDGWAWEFSIEIIGTQISDWSISDSIFGALAGATCLNVLVMVYMTDQVDLGGFKKALKKRKW